MYFGINDALKRMNYIETDGDFSHSELRSSTDSDGYTSYSYEWYYNYYVNGERFQASSTGHKQDRPQDNNDKVLYDANNPSTSVMSSDNTSLVLMIFGSVFVAAPILMTLLSNENNQKAYEKKFACVWLAFVAAIFMMLFAKSNFSFSNMINETGFVFIFVIILFAAVGIYLLIRKERPNEEIDYKNNTSFYDENSEKIEKASNIVFKIVGIVEIAVGIVWSSIVLLIHLLPLIFSGPNTTYSLNGNIVSKEEFFLDPISNIPFIIFLLVGIIITVRGILSLKNSNKNI